MGCWFYGPVQTQKGVTAVGAQYQSLLAAAICSLARNEAFISKWSKMEDCNKDEQSSVSGFRWWRVFDVRGYFRSGGHADCCKRHLKKEVVFFFVFFTLSSSSRPTPSCASNRFRAGGPLRVSQQHAEAGSTESVEFAPIFIQFKQDEGRGKIKLPDFKMYHGSSSQTYAKK